MKETSKLFKQLGGTKKSQRGIVARNALKRLDKFEMAEFEKGLVKIEFTNIPVREGGKIVRYL